MAAPLCVKFDEEKEEWSQYVEWLDHFSEVKSPMLTRRELYYRRIGHWSISPASPYELLWNLLAPAKPNDKTYTELVGILKEHHSSKPSEMVQRFWINLWFSSARGVSIHLCVGDMLSCKFGTALEDMLRDWLVCGINNSAIQWKLLSEHNLMFVKVLEMVQSTRQQ